ncbi:MAG: IS110 family transposase [Gemmatimonas sp.]|nr:IS110 family transposase [Gemmatimonas sp.]
MKRNRRRNGRPRPKSPSLLERINVDVAGIDCGAEAHYVAVPTDRDSEPVRSFRTFTADLHRLADWLTECGVRSVAMEATGVYWIPVYEILEARGIEVRLVNAQHVKNVPGRKSDVQDCEWLRELHSVGLLRGSFRPADQIVALRGYLRHRDTLIENMSDAIRRMQKALDQMNVQLARVISDITGVTGMAILHDIVEGRTHAEQLARHRDRRCKASEAEFVAALTGNYRPEHVFALKQNLQLYELHQGMLRDCDMAIEAHLQALTAEVDSPSEPLPPRRSKRQHKGNEPAFDLRGYLHHLAGIDLSQIHGIGPYQSLRLISEIGTDMTRWPDEDHFTSWLTLASQNKITGGRRISSRTQPSQNRAAEIFRMAAMSVGRTQTALGAFYRRMAARIGNAKAITATARKIAILVYRSLKGEIVYQDPGPDAYNAAQRQRALKHLRKRAKYLGFALVNVETGELVPS